MMHDLEAIRARLRLSDLVGGSVIWDARKSNARRGDFWAPCPFHAERSASFHVRDGIGRYHCFGCQAKGDHFSWAQDMMGAGDFRAAADMLAGLAGVVPGAAAPARPRGPDPARLAAEAEAAATGLERARRVWEASVPDHPILTAYLTARGVRVDALRAATGALPPALRCHPDLPYFEPGPDGRMRVVHSGPAMVARIGRGAGAGVHRTWITRTGRARDVTGAKLAKRWLGRTGGIFGQPVVLGDASQAGQPVRMIVGEGIETVLVLLSRLALRGEVWGAEAALSRGALTGGGDRAFDTLRTKGPMAGRMLESSVPDFSTPSWSPPDRVAELVVLAEGSAKDPELARRLTLRAVARHRWRADGTARLCRYILPGNDWARDVDFADMGVLDHERA